MFNRPLSLLLALILSATSCTSPRPGAREGFLTTHDSLSLYYRVLGRNQDTAVVVHGGPGAGMGSILPHLAPLSDSLTLIFYDQRGGGRSSLPQDLSLLSPHGFVADLEAVRTHFGLDRMKLIAHSFGAIVVAEYLREHPDRVDRLVLLGATGPSRAEAAAVARAEAEESTGKGDRAAGDPEAARSEAAEGFDVVGTRQEALQALLAGTSDDPLADCERWEGRSDSENETRWKGTNCDMPPEAVRYYFQYTAQVGPEGFGEWDYTNGSLAGVTAPALVVQGADDERGRSLQEAWVRALPAATLWAVPEAERPAIAHRPDTVLAGILRFLRQ